MCNKDFVTSAVKTIFSKSFLSCNLTQKNEPCKIKKNISNCLLCDSNFSNSKFKKFCFQQLNEEESFF